MNEKVTHDPAKTLLPDYLTTLQSTLKESGFATTNFQLTKIKKFTFRSDINAIREDNSYLLSANNITESHSQESLKVINESLSKITKEHPRILPPVEFEALQTGKMFTPINRLLKVNDSTEYTITHNKGEKMIILYDNPLQTSDYLNNFFFPEIRKYSKANNFRLVYISYTDTDYNTINKEHVDLLKEKYYHIDGQCSMRPRITVVDEEGTVVVNEYLFAINIDDILSNNPAVDSDGVSIKNFKNFIKDKFSAIALDIYKAGNLKPKAYSTIEVLFPITIYYDHQLNKAKSYRHPIIRCEVDKKQQNCIDKIITQLTTIFKPHIEYYNQNSKEQSLADIKRIQEIIKSYDIPMSFNFNKTCSLNITDYFINNLYHKGVDFNPVPSTYVSKVSNLTKQLTEEARNFKNQFIFGNLKMKCKYEKDEVFNTFKAEDLYSDTIIDITPEEGKITLLLFWSSTCIFSQYHIEEINKLIDKLGKDNIICYALSYDKIKQHCINFLKSKEPVNNIKQCQLINPVRENEIITLFSAYTVPTIGVINKNGKLAYTGHPNDILLEKLLIKLLNDDSFNIPEIANPEAVKVEPVKVKISKDAYKNLKKAVFSDEFINKLKNAWIMPKLPDMNITFTKSAILDANNYKCTEYYKPTLDIKIKRKDYEKVYTYLSTLIPNIYLFNINKNLTESITIDFGEKCKLCEKQLGKFVPQFYCHFCKIYLCPECANAIADETKEGNAKLKHSCNNLVYINIKKEGDMDIETELLGNNEQALEDDLCHSGYCNYCDDRVSDNPRYICLTCGKTMDGLLDLCQGCVGEICNGEINELESKEKLGDHDAESHLLLRIYFNTGGYFEY
jgi:hypothetical protein